MITIDQSMNASGSSADVLSCSGGVVSCQEGLPPSCSTNTWTVGPDGIADSCDNGDYRGTYTSGSVASLLSSDSKTMDNDDLARRRIFGLIPPGQTGQIFAMNTPVQQAVLLNTNNTGPAILPSTVDSVTLDGVFSATGMNLTLYQINKTEYDTNKNILILNTYSGSVLSLTGALSTAFNFDNSGAAPFALNIRSYDYVLFLTNPSLADTGIISYEIGATNLGQPVYIVPLNDAVTPKTLLVPDYRFFRDTLIYRGKIVSE